MMYLFASIFIAAGVLIPSKTLTLLLRSMPPDPILSHQLIVGASLFRFGLIVLGIVMILLKRSSYLQSSGSTEPDPGSRMWNVAILILLIVSAGFRFYKLDQGLWLDEIGMFIKYLRLTPGELFTTYNSENQHFLYTILADISCSFFGGTAWGMRLPAVLFGVASLWALYLLGTAVTDRREAFLSTVLLSFSFYHIWFSQNARGYIGLLFWTLLSSYFLVRGMEKKHPRIWIRYALCAALGIYTQFTMVFIVIGQFLIYLKWVLSADREARKQSFLLGFCLGGLITFVLYAPVLPQFLNVIGMKGTVPEWNSPLWTLGEFFKALRVTFKNPIAVIGAAAVFLAGAISYLHSKPVLIPLFVLPAAIGAGIVLMMGHPLWPRFFFFVYGFAALIAVRGTTVVAKFLLPKKAVFAGTVLSIAMILVSCLAIPIAYFPKQDFVGAMNFVNSQRQADDEIATIGRISVPYSKYFHTNWAEIKSLESLRDLQTHHKRVWLLYMIPRDVEAVYPEIWKFIRNDFREVKKFKSSLTDGAIYIARWDRPA